MRPWHPVCLRQLDGQLRARVSGVGVNCRLNVTPSRIPPLRERASDLPLLANLFLRIYGVRYGKSSHGFSRAAMDRLQAWRWPGNSREPRHGEPFLIKETLRTTGGNKQRAAGLLGIAARTIHRKLDQ